ncbi:MAG: two-component system, response regulator PdtaR [Gaiellaceae bacterium]|jgi:response regulator NasT|nr:two-component system, response regulator PdtaR [Gaiellaceae bacterium]
MTDSCATPLRVLLANERSEHLEQIAHIIARLGHVVTAHETDIAAVAARTEVGIFDVAIVGVGEDTEHALDLIGRIVREANCPVIAILDSEDAAFIHQAAKRGVFAYITASQTSDDQLASAIDVVLARFTEFNNLAGAFGRRALTERAKGILMERHSIDEDVAFLLLRDQSRKTNRKLIDVAQAILDARALLPGGSSTMPPE